MKPFAALALSLATLSFAAPAAAQFEKPEDAIKYRQSALFVMGQHFGRIGAMANGKIPFDAKVAQENADVVGAMNVLARGHRVAACGEEGAGLARKRKTKPASVKQEPTEVCQLVLAGPTVGIPFL